MTDDEKRKLIEERCEREGLRIDGWLEDHEDGVTADLGGYRVIEEDEDKGLYDDDVGQMTASVVGSPEYGNVRVSLTFTPEGNDPGSGPEVNDLSVLEPV